MRIHQLAPPVLGLRPTVAIIRTLKAIIATLLVSIITQVRIRYMIIVRSQPQTGIINGIAEVYV